MTNAARIVGFISGALASVCIVGGLVVGLVVNAMDTRDVRLERDIKIIEACEDAPERENCIEDFKDELDSL